MEKKCTAFFMHLSCLRNMYIYMHFSEEEGGKKIFRYLWNIVSWWKRHLFLLDAFVYHNNHPGKRKAIREMLFFFLFLWSFSRIGDWACANYISQAYMGKSERVHTCQYMYTHIRICESHRSTLRREKEKVRIEPAYCNCFYLCILGLYILRIRGSRKWPKFARRHKWFAMVFFPSFFVIQRKIFLVLLEWFYRKIMQSGWLKSWFDRVCARLTSRAKSCASRDRFNEINFSL